MKKNRKIEIDIVKCIGIILMIFGHVFPNSIFDKWIHGFHMPLFFIVSGLLLKDSFSIKSDIIKKIKSLLIPYLFISFFHFLIYLFKDVVFTGSLNYFAMFQYLKNIFWINNENIAICGAVWFLTAFFITNLIIILIENYIKKSKLKGLIYVTITLIGIILTRLNITLPFSICQGLVGVGFFYIGILAKNLKIITNPKVIYGICGLLIGTIIIQLNYPINMRTMQFRNEILFFISASIMTLSLLIISSKFKNVNNIILKEFAYIGEYSIMYLSFNQLILFALNDIIPFGVLKFILIFVIIRFAIPIIKRSRFKYLFGIK